MANYSPALQVMVQAARKAGRGLARDFGETAELQVSRKGPADFVSAADLRAEEVLYAELSKARPGYSFLLEEKGLIAGSDKSHRFIIDPLDGTTNFLHGIPHFAISIALERDGLLTAAVIYSPARDELFTAERGRGAYLNDRRLRVSARSDLGDSLIATGMPFRGKEGHGSFLAELTRVMAATAGVRRYGAAALDLAYVASGRFDGFWERGLQPWDVAAGILTVREAGGEVGPIDPGADPLAGGQILATNGNIHRSLSDLLGTTKSGHTRSGVG